MSNSDEFRAAVPQGGAPVVDESVTEAEIKEAMRTVFIGRPTYVRVYRDRVVIDHQDRARENDIIYLDRD